MTVTPDAFEDYLKQLLESDNDAEEAVTHPAAEKLVGSFADMLDTMLDEIPEIFQHFMSCSVGVLEEAHELKPAADPKLRSRQTWFYFCLMLFGMYIGLNRRNIEWLITSRDSQ